MLIRFAVENWMSFREEAILSMIASPERQHSERVRKLSSYRARLVPVAAIYGGNASGKSNLIKAISFAQDLIVSGPKSSGATRVSPFRLERRYEGRPTRFRFEVLIENSIYEYSFAITSKKVVEEQLKRIRITTEELIFRRTVTGLELGEALSDREALQIVFAGTHDNQLYLTNSVSQKRLEFRKIFDWFEDVLRVIYPLSHYGGLPYITRSGSALYDKMTTRLRELDSGISTLRHKDIPIERIPAGVKSQIVEDEDNDAVYGVDVTGEGHVFVFKEQEKLMARKLATIHKSKRGENIEFSLDDESDGTRRLLDILPAFIMLEDVRLKRVFVIDELDRSLHPLLARSLLDRFLTKFGATSQTQLIFTSHNIQLMDQSLFRRDEIWVTERDANGASTLNALSEFRDVRNDKDIRKSYLQGRMGGIPRLRTGIKSLAQ